MKSDNVLKRLIHEVEGESSDSDSEFEDDLAATMANGSTHDNDPNTTVKRTVTLGIMDGHDSPHDGGRAPDVHELEQRVSQTVGYIPARPT